MPSVPPRDPPDRRPPLPLQVGRAIEGNVSLASLLARLNDSKRRFEAIVPLLPEALRSDVQPGPLDDQQWTLLASNAAAAAKLRQMLPALTSTLESVGWAGPVLKVKVLPRR